MNVGVLKEIKQDEGRVSLQPNQAAILISDGHGVWVEQGAGDISGFTDAEYAAKGAEIVPKGEVLDRCQLLLKVKAPEPSEIGDYGANQTLFCYLHFDENIPAEKIERMIDSGFLGIAYEWVGEPSNHPLLRPMSRLTGYIGASKAVELCTRHKGIFCSGNETFLPRSHVMIIGLGNIGLSAFKYFFDNGVGITVVNNATRDTAEEAAASRFGSRGFGYFSGSGVAYVRMDEADPRRTRDAITDALPQCDIVINAAVRRTTLPKEKLEFIIDRSMLSQLAPNSVICDATANDRDLIETAVSSAALHQTDTVDGIIHYACDHIPALAPRTATRLLTEQSFPYTRRMANAGIAEAIRQDAFLRNGVSCFRGHLTHRYAAEKKGLPHTPILDLIG